MRSISPRQALLVRFDECGQGGDVRIAVVPGHPCAFCRLDGHREWIMARIVCSGESCPLKSVAFPAVVEGVSRESTHRQTHRQNDRQTGGARVTAEEWDLSLETTAASRAV